MGTAKKRGRKRRGGEGIADATVDLPAFLKSVPPLTVEDRKVIVRQALILIEHNYAHLPLKRAMHAVDPVQRLRILMQRLEDGKLPMGDTDFHREMTGIFTSLHDLHTNYLLPEPYASRIACLPFVIEDYTEKGERHYIVAHIAPEFSHDDFREGVEITHWNGMQIERAVAVQARHYAGSNPDAQHARAVETMTMRMLRVVAPPDEDWVIVGYKTADGTQKEVRFDWKVRSPQDLNHEADAAATADALGLDLEQHLVYKTRKALFAAHVPASAAVTETDPLASTLPTVFEARAVDTPSGTFGYIRIRTFSVSETDKFVAEFLRLITALPQNGLIIDVRGNGGGVIYNGEQILQFLTPRRIEPEPAQFLTTTLNRELCTHNTKLEKWAASMGVALQTGAAFSAGFPISDADACNRFGQRYFGPVVLITDALCYSTTDIFAAGFQDHRIGDVLGVDSTTGAGGANVWTHAMLWGYLKSRYEQLPKGAAMRVSIRRTLRVGSLAGTPVEDLGVHADEPHPLTRNDLLNRNEDLINHAGKLLAKKLPARSMRVEVANGSVNVVTSGMDRLDVYFDDRPSDTFDVHDGKTTFTVAGTTLEIRGFDLGELVARYREEL